MPPSSVAFTERSWISRCWATAATPAVRQLAQWVHADGAARLGLIEQLIIERSLVDGDDRGALAELVRDAALVRLLAGTVDRVSALGTAADDKSATNLSVNMTTAGGVLGTAGGGSDRVQINQCHVTQARDQGLCIGGATKITQFAPPLKL